MYYFSPLTLVQLFANCGLKVIYRNPNSLDLRVVAVKETDKRPEINTSTFINLYSGKRVRSIIKRQGYKYASLRVFKRAGEAIFPRKVFNYIHRNIIKLLRKLNVINV